MKRLALPLLAAVMLGSPALAQTEPPTLVFAGSYQFVTTEKLEGKPVCTETWIFTAPDTLEVRSGEEIVLSVFHTENDRDGRWLVTKAIVTNGKPDCMGKAREKVSGLENRISILRFNDGTMLVCPPPGHTDDGIPVHGECFASLNRIAG